VELPEVCVVYLLRDGDDGPQVLLGDKRTGLGRGKVVGIGGKLEPGETPAEAAVREMREETGMLLAAADLEPVGVIDYRFPSRPAWSQRSHVFVARRWRGDPVETREISPRWYAREEVPYARMWDDARRWLPDVLRGGRVHAAFDFGDDLATVVAERRESAG
jgi:8-oxo-dGTP diphosphatase